MRMRIVIQRVSSASVEIRGSEAGEIGGGLLVLLGIEESDAREDADWLVGKLTKMRIFPDAGGLMNRSVTDAAGSILVVSQFTLHASTKKGNRPSFIRAARPEQAIPLYEYFLSAIEFATGARPERGEFGADMQVKLVNDGPVTIIMDSRSRE